jgi:hypothetical protein
VLDESASVPGGEQAPREKRMGRKAMILCSELATPSVLAGVGVVGRVIREVRMSWICRPTASSNAAWRLGLRAFVLGQVSRPAALAWSPGSQRSLPRTDSPGHQRVVGHPPTAS